MTDKELRILNVEVAIAIGFARIDSRRGGYHDAHYDLFSKFGGRCYRNLRSVSVAMENLEYACPEYSTNNAAAMALLERCVKESRPYQVQIDSGPKFSVHSGFDGTLKASAETLPHAIALFAKALFSK